MTNEDMAKLKQALPKIAERPRFVNLAPEERQLAVLAELKSYDLDDAPLLDTRALDKLRLDKPELVIPNIIDESVSTVSDLLRLFVN